MLFSPLAALLLASGAFGALVQVQNFGDNPGRAAMYINVPSKLATSPAIVLALHPCGGNGPQFNQMTKYASVGEQQGFITIFPSALQTNEHCWEIATKASNTHNGGSDTLSLVNMVKYTLDKYKADPKKVFATGTSSGGMMTNLLAATYPDIFAAGSAYSGMPASCLLGSPGSGPGSADPNCANGKAIKTADQWGQAVKNAYPGYTGSYPKMAIWHGTADTFVSYQNLAETLKQWSNVFSVAFTGNTTNTPQSGYTRMNYGDGTKLAGYSASGVGHTVPVHENDDLKWFGLM